MLLCVVATRETGERGISALRPRHASGRIISLADFSFNQYLSRARPAGDAFTRLTLRRSRRYAEDDVACEIHYSADCSDAKRL